MARTSRRSYRLVRKYAAVPVGESHSLKETWVRPDHTAELSVPLTEQPAEQLVGPSRALIHALIQKRADELAEELQKGEPDEEASEAIYTRAEAEVLAWRARTRPTIERLEREVFGALVPVPKRGRPKGSRRGPGDEALRAEFLKLPPSVRRSKLEAAKRLQHQFPSVPVNTLRQRLAKIDK